MISGFAIYGRVLWDGKIHDQLTDGVASAQLITVARLVKGRGCIDTGSGPTFCLDGFLLVLAGLHFWLPVYGCINNRFACCCVAWLLRNWADCVRGCPNHGCLYSPLSCILIGSDLSATVFPDPVWKYKYGWESCLLSRKHMFLPRLVSLHENCMRTHVGELCLLFRDYFTLKN